MVPNQRLARALTFRVAVLTLLWWALLGHEVDSWSVGVPTIIAAALTSLVLAPSARVPFSLVAAVIVAPKLVYRALAGGLDVAKRVLAPSLPISPSLVRLEMTLGSPFGQWCYAHCVSLLPGTLAVDIDGQEVIVHILADEPQALNELAALHRDLTRVFPD